MYPSGIKAVTTGIEEFLATKTNYQYKYTGTIVSTSEVFILSYENGTGADNGRFNIRVTSEEEIIEGDKTPTQIIYLQVDIPGNSSLARQHEVIKRIEEDVKKTQDYIRGNQI